MMEAVREHHGFVAQVAGDGVLALFGANRDDEAHARRALDAAIEMQRAMRAYAARVRDADVPALEIRIGVSTGEVVVRSVRIGAARSENLPIGQATGIAARIQSLAQAGAIVASAGTRRAAGDGFKYRRLGHHAVKGASQPVEIFELLDASTAARARTAAERLRLLLTRVGFQETCVVVGSVAALVAAFYLLTLIGPTPEPGMEGMASDLSLVRAYTEVHDWRDPKLEAVLHGSLETCKRLKHQGCEFITLVALRAMHATRGDLAESDAAARRMLEIAANVPSKPEMLVWAHCAMGAVLRDRGLLVESMKHFEQGLQVAERYPLTFPKLIDDPRPYCLADSASPLLAAGYADQARQRAARSLKLARESGEPFVLANSTWICGWALADIYDLAAPRHLPREFKEELRSINEGIAVAQARGYSAIERGLKRHKAARLYFGGKAEQSIKELRELGFVEEAGVTEGIHRGGNYIYPALKYAEAWGASPEPLRLRGELWLRAAPPRELEAERCFRQAIATARNADFKYPELRATLSLSQLLARQGRLEEARDALRPIYSWFTEGFDVPVMVRAKKLLDELDAKIAAKRKPPLQASS